jgi:phage-related protein
VSLNWRRGFEFSRAEPSASSRSSDEQPGEPMAEHASICSRKWNRLSRFAVYTQTDIMAMKPLQFLGNSLMRLREFPRDAKHDVGYQLSQVQHGKQPTDFKPMPSIGRGVDEFTVWGDSGTYRVVYTARLVEAVYVLHVFQKKTRATAKRDINLARERFAHLMKDRR